MTTNTTALVKQLRNALIDARDDVQAELQRCTELAGRPATDRRLAAQVALALDVDIAIAAADQWLAEQPAQKPVAWITYDEYSSGSYSPPYREKRLSWHKPAKNGTPLYATPQAVAPGGWKDGTTDGRRNGSA